MKKTYIKPESVVVAINAKEHLMDVSLQSLNARKLDAPEQVNGGDTQARELEIISEEFNIIARSAWQKW